MNRMITALLKTEEFLINDATQNDYYDTAWFEDMIQDFRKQIDLYREFQGKQFDVAMDNHADDIVREMLEQEEENRLLKSVLDERKLMAEFYLRWPDPNPESRDVFERELQTIERIIQKFGLDEE